MTGHMHSSFVKAELTPARTTTVLLAAGLTALLGAAWNPARDGVKVFLEVIANDILGFAKVEI